MKAVEVEKCINLFGTDIYRFCIKLCADKSEAEDLYQETFLKALERELVLDWENNPKALFFSLAHNLWKSSLRRTARRAEIAPTSSIGTEHENLLQSGESIEGNYFQKELCTEVNRAIEALPDKIRVPMTLYYLFEFPIEQVATTIGKPPGTVKSRLYKGRSLIKKKLEVAGYGEE